MVMIIKPRKLEGQDELQHLSWPDKSHDLNIFKPLEEKSEKPVPTFNTLKQLACSDIQLETIQKLNEYILYNGS